MSISVIIPTYRPGGEFAELLRRLALQRQKPDEILVINTDPAFWDAGIEKRFPGLRVTQIPKEAFDHGGTRRMAASLARGEILLYMTQDALPADRELIGALTKALSRPLVGAAYARQLPKGDCAPPERFTRHFNYPPDSFVNRKEDIAEKGIKAFFCSNVCAAYKRKALEEIGGFQKRAIFNEDMIAARALLEAGYGIAYESGARVFHSHNYTLSQQFRRNFDLGVSQKMNPEVFGGVPAEGEGIRLVRQTLSTLVRSGQVSWCGPVIAMSAAKYAGYLLGKQYDRLSPALRKKLSMNPAFWEQEGAAGGADRS